MPYPSETAFLLMSVLFLTEIPVTFWNGTRVQKLFTELFRVTGRKKKNKIGKNQLNLMIYICWSSNHMVRVKFMFLCYDGLDVSKGNFYIITVNF